MIIIVFVPGSCCHECLYTLCGKIKVSVQECVRIVTTKSLHKKDTQHLLYVRSFMSNKLGLQSDCLCMYVKIYKYPFPYYIIQTAYKALPSNLTWTICKRTTGKKHVNTKWWWIQFTLQSTNIWGTSWVKGFLTYRYIWHVDNCHIICRNI